MTNNGEISIPKVWRSEMKLMLLFAASSLVSIVGSWYFPSTVLRGTIISLGDWRIECVLPLLWVIPLFIVALATFRIYNVRYKLTSRGIDCYDWVLGPQSVMSIRYEDIRSIETEQSILGRMFDVGDVLIGTAAQSTVEVVFKGVACPTDVQQLIQRERDRRHQLEKAPYQYQGRAEP